MQSLNKPVILFDIDYTLFDTALFKKTNLTQFSIYNEVAGALSALSGKFILGIFSQGEENLQKSKLKATKIDHFFQKENTHIESNKEESIKTIIEKYKNTPLIIIDDKLFILYQMKQINPVIFTIWIKRGVYAENQIPITNFMPDADVLNLKEVIPIINKKYGLT